MSAFLVGHDHIDALLTFAVEKRVSYWNKDTDSRVEIRRENATEIGRILIAENVRSIQCRYPDDDGEDDTASYYFTRWVEPVSGVAILKGCSCFDYQACETSDYETTLAHTIVDAIRHHAIYDVPGWDNAPGWEFRRERVGA